MKSKIVASADVQLCTERFFPSLFNIVSQKCGLYSCFCCKAPLYTLCGTCAQDFLYATPCCAVCEKFSVSGELHHICKTTALLYTHTLSCFAYTKTVKSLFRHYKYDETFLLQKEIEHMINAYFRADPFQSMKALKKFLSGKSILFVPVPMSRRKETERGFSPAYEFSIIFARLFMTYLNVETWLCKELLIKSTETAAQAKKKRFQRLITLQKAYTLTNEIDFLTTMFHFDALCIVDDIVTTGATMNVVLERIAQQPTLREYFSNKPILRLSFAQATR